LAGVWWIERSGLFRTVSRRQIVGPSVFDVRMHGPLWMIGGVLASIDCGSLKRLIRIGQFRDAFFGRIFDLRKLLQISGLSGTVRSHFVCAGSQFVKLCLIITARPFYHCFPPGLG
jgi:hypothetical protein